MADSLVRITEGSGLNIDTRTESTNTHHRQVVVLGDPSSNNAVAEVRATDPDSNSEGIVVRDVHGSLIAARLGSTIATYIHSTAGTLSIKANDGTFAVYFSPSEPTIKGITNTIGVYVHSTAGTIAIGAKDGTFAVYFNPANPKVSIGSDIVAVNAQHTASIAAAGGTVSGSTSVVSVSGQTIISPEASRSIKVYAIGITTTAQVHLTARFTNGAGTSPTEYWRYALQAPSQGIAGANLSVTPPGYLFATAANTTLSLLLDSASLVHYSVAYFKEAA